jgi:hypothetical protein
MVSTTPPWIRSAAMPTRFMTASLTRWQCSTRSMWSGSAPRSLTRSVGACSQDTLGCRCRKHDPLYQIRGLLRHRVEHLTEC